MVKGSFVLLFLFAFIDTGCARAPIASVNNKEMEYSNQFQQLLDGVENLKRNDKPAYITYFEKILYVPVGKVIHVSLDSKSFTIELPLGVDQREYIGRMIVIYNVNPTHFICKGTSVSLSGNGIICTEIYRDSRYLGPHVGDLAVVNLDKISP